MTLITTGILVLIILGLVFFMVKTYNGFVSKRNFVEEAFSGIDVMLKKRFDLIPNLIETVKGYTTHEKETLTAIVTLRNQALSATNGEQKLQLDASLGQAITKIFALAENYPDLKASINFQTLQTELANLETDIERSKRYYNGTVREYNISIETFPANVLANTFGFAKKNFLELMDTTQRETPVVKF